MSSYYIPPTLFLSICVFLSFVSLIRALSWIDVIGLRQFLLGKAKGWFQTLPKVWRKREGRNFCRLEELDSCEKIIYLYIKNLNLESLLKDPDLEPLGLVLIFKGYGSRTESHKKMCEIHNTDFYFKY